MTYTAEEVSSSAAAKAAEVFLTSKAEECLLKINSIGGTDMFGLSVNIKSNLLFFSSNQGHISFL